MWRMDEHFEEYRKLEFSDLSKAPSDYVRQQCFVSIDSDEWPGVATLTALGGHQVVWGSDYPHRDGKFPVAYKTLSSIPGMTADFLSNVVDGTRSNCLVTR